MSEELRADTRQTASEWDFFIAHAGPDSEIAEALYDAIGDRARTFLDSRCLKPGDDWSLALPRAQRNARVMVVLVSSSSEAAYYQREEIAAAIDTARHATGDHRVVPVYLDTHGPERADVPYGLRLRHGVPLTSREQLPHVAQVLLDVLHAPKDVDAVTPHAPDFLHASLTGFVGRTRRGPANNGAVLVGTFAEFVDVFGAPVDPAESFLGYAIRGFFDNGGRQAAVVRVVPRDVSTAEVEIPDEAGLPCIVARACDPGSWATHLYLNIEEGARVGLRIVLTASASCGDIGEVLEDYDNVGIDPAGPNYLLTVLAQSKTIRADWTGTSDRNPQKGRWELTGGNDGSELTADDYLGMPDSSGWARSGLAALDDHPDVALLCVPDCCHPTLSPRDRARLANEVVARAERNRQVAIMAPEAGERDPKARHDSAYAVSYAPWVWVPGVGVTEPVLVPPIGHVAGAYAQRDSEHGIHASLTPLTVKGLQAEVGRLGALEADLDAAQADRLRRRGINALRATDEPAVVMAETAVTTALRLNDQDARFRRQVDFILRSLILGTHWIVFEPNSEDARRRLVEQITEFLNALWQNGVLSGASAEEAFHIRCDDSTMTQQDRESGRIVCHVAFNLAEPTTSPSYVLSFGEFGIDSSERSR